MYVDDMPYTLVHCVRCFHGLQARVDRTSERDEFVERPKRTESMRQVKFECSEGFYQRLNEEKFRRNLTLQQLAIRALERYLAFPESIHRRIDEEIQDADEPTQFLGRLLRSKEFRRLLNKYAHPIPSGVDPETERLALELRRLVEVIEAYLQQFPTDKLRLLEQSLALDLKFYRSARIKAGHTGELVVGMVKSHETKGDD
jgi:hypothetical protein